MNIITCTCSLVLHFSHWILQLNLEWNKYQLASFNIWCVCICSSEIQVPVIVKWQMPKAQIKNVDLQWFQTMNMFLSFNTESHRIWRKPQRWLQWHISSIFNWKESESWIMFTGKLLVIRSNYRTYPYKCIVKQFRSLQITASVLFCLLLYKGICYGHSFELHQLVNAIQMSIHNICLYKENQKKIV